MTKVFTKIDDVLKRFDVNKDKYISAEFQKYGYDLAVELGDLKHKALYIKLAKTTPRSHLESAKTFVKDALNAKSKARLFMWKLKQISIKKNAGKLG
ncbi:MAG: hypothetical protein US96_C0014G0018 [Candidatus Woesebacteria bacterium GW2011_GWB1_38_5b]|uniref:Uncharacterized protein n=1 Tax=Candidatus Woesebacteria bacterium GW2011_GWB1_38_5b TaxID=1618569 RepID=A0A0G0KIC2_9BACT|nr:MAG: hypothetical protein US96_C0014G0018 [Candidatus Woesebacteria bacterium GW2011_GWB1_38_5b]